MNDTQNDRNETDSPPLSSRRKVLVTPDGHLPHGCL
jgi:hypothetical protein